MNSTRNLTCHVLRVSGRLAGPGGLHVFTVLSRAQEVNDNDTPIVRRYCTTCFQMIESYDFAVNPKSAALQQCWVCRHVRLHAERDSKALSEEAQRMHS